MSNVSAETEYRLSTGGALSTWTAGLPSQQQWCSVRCMGQAWQESNHAAISSNHQTYSATAWLAKHCKTLWGHFVRPPPHPPTHTHTVVAHANCLKWNARQGEWLSVWWLIVVGLRSRCCVIERSWCRSLKARPTCCTLQLYMYVDHKLASTPTSQATSEMWRLISLAMTLIVCGTWLHHFLITRSCHDINTLQDR